MYIHTYGPKHTLMYSWCELGYDYLFFRGGGVLLRRHELEKECFVVVVWRPVRIRIRAYSRENGVAANTENTLFRWPTNWQSCGVITEIRFYTK